MNWLRKKLQAWLEIDLELPRDIMNLHDENYDINVVIRRLEKSLMSICKSKKCDPVNKKCVKVKK